MAVFLQQVITVFLNRKHNHETMCNVLRSILDDNTAFDFGTQHEKGAEAIIDFFENTSKAIASDMGFVAKPVIICQTNDPKYGITENQKVAAVALFSKLEDYISWFFIFRMNPETSKLLYIKGIRGMGYGFYEDYYNENTWDFSKWEVKL